jgi:transcription elongation factor Elf1
MSDNHLESRLFKCPKCDAAETEVKIYFRDNVTAMPIQCDSCQDIFLWDWNEKKLYSMYKTTDYDPQEYFRLNDENE